MAKSGSYGAKNTTDFTTGTYRSANDRTLTFFRSATDSTTLRSQYFSMPSRTLKSSMLLFFNWWLTDWMQLIVNNTTTYAAHHSHRDAFADEDAVQPGSGRAVTPDGANFMRSVGHDWQNEVQVGLTLNAAKGLRFIPSLTWRSLREQESYRYGGLDTAAVRHTAAWLPKLAVRWNISRQRKFSFDFSCTATAPDLSQTFAFVDMRDPLYTRVGNPSLLRSRDYEVKATYARTWPRRQTMVNFGVGYHRDIRPLTTLYTYNSAMGAYTAMPVNAKGGDTYSLNLDIDQGIGFYMRLNNQLSTQWMSDYGFLTRASFDDEPVVNRRRDFRLKDNLELSYETELLQLSLYDRLQLDRYRYSAAAGANSTPLTMTYGINARMKPKPFEFYADVYDDFRSGFITSGMNGHRWIVGAGASWLLCKGKLLLSLDADDIFNRKRTRFSTYSAYETYESTSDFLHHYLAFSVKYTFSAKGKGKEKRIYDLM